MQKRVGPLPLVTVKSLGFETESHHEDAWILRGDVPLCESLDAESGSGYFGILPQNIQSEAAIQTPPASLMKSGLGLNRDP
jgi:hypothetical protein